jgi:PAS domain S-box-containing protein
MNLIKADINVLVIEDNPGDQFLLREQLCAVINCKENIQFTETLSASVELLSRFSPDIILLDLTLPDSKGIETFEFINEHCSSIPIVILSGLEDTKLAIHAITLGAQDYLQKGNFDEDLLFRTIRYSIERKKTMEELRTSNERYLLVSKATNDMVWDWDIRKDTVYRNEEQFCRMLKLPPHLKDHGGEFWHGRIHPEDAMRVESEMMSIQSNPEKLFFELEYRFLNGEDQYIHLFDRGYIIRDNDGKPVRLIGSTQDITTQKEINSELQKLSLIARETQNGVIITDKDKKIEWVNHAFEQISGYTFEEVKGKNPGQFLQGKDTDPAQVAFMRSQFNRQKNFEVELVNYSKQGKNYWINLQVQPIFDEKGQLQKYFSIQSDITAEKRAEEALRRSEDQYRYLFDNNPAPIFIWNVDDFSFAEVNETFIETYGYSRQELASMTIKQIRPDDQVDDIVAFAKTARKSEQFQVARLWKHMNKRGEIMYMQISSQKIVYKGRWAVLAIAIDITEKKLLELKLEEERRQKEKEITNAVLTAQENEKEYIGRELHDNVNQILASARLFVGLSKSKTTPENLQQADDLLSKAIEEIRILSHSLIPPSFEVTQLGESLEQLINIVESTTPIRFNKQYCRTDYSGVSKLVQLTIYRTVQEQLNNIIKYANAKHVLIKTDRNDEDLFLKIEDDGIGFDTGKKSMGVGLLNIQTRAAISNGTMHLESSPGNGCKLHLHFKL